MSFRFDAIRLRHVRGFGEEGMALEGLAPGLNVLSQPNEFGKSTILAAVKAALFFKATADNKIVKSLYGLAGDPPEIEIDLTADEHTLRLSKRFRKGRGESKLFELPGLREIAREADAEREVLRLVGADKPESGAGGLLWVEQGAALDELQAAHKTTIAEALASEVSDATSSEDALRVVKAIAAELADLETPRTGKPTKRLLAALTDAEESRAALAEAEAILERAQTYRSRIVTLEARSRELASPDESARHRQELDAARHEARELQKKVESIGHTEREAARLRSARDQLLNTAERFTQDLERLKTLEKSTSMASANEAQLAEKLGHTAAFVADSAKALQDIEARSNDLRRDLDRARAFERFAEERATVDAAAMALKEAKAKQVEQAKAAAIAARGAISLNALRELERDMLVAEATLDAAAPEVELLSGRGAALEGKELKLGEKTKLRGEAELAVGDARIAIRAALPRDLTDQQDRAKKKLDDLLAAFGVESLAEAEAEALARQEAEAKTKRLAGEIKALAPKGLSALETFVATEPVAPAGDPPSQTRAALEAALSETEVELAPARARFDDAKSREQAAEKALVECRAQAKASKDELERLLTLVGDPQEREAKQTKLSQDIAEQAALLAHAEQSLEGLRREKADQDAADRRVKRLEEAENNRSRELSDLKVDMAQLEGQLMQIYEEGPEESRDAAAERLEVAEARLERLEARRRVLNRLMATLEEVQSERRDRLLKPLVDAAAPLVDRVFGTSVLRFGSDLTPENLERSGRAQTVDILSAGAREQIAIVTRLGMARLFAERDQAVPLILDDALIYADDERTQRLFDAIHMVAEETQVIVLTCHERRFDSLGGHRLRPVPFPSRS